MRLERIEKELQDSQQALLEAHGEKDRLRVQMQQADLMKDKNDVELGNAKMELQRQFIEVENKRAIELDQLRGTEDDSRRRLAAEAAVWEGEKIDLQHKMRELNRKLEEQQDDLRVLQQQNVELKGDRTRLNEDIERV